MATYELIDEPSPSTISHLAVRPMWPLLSAMLAGSWLGFPWLLFNSFALGSATRKREMLILGGGLLGLLAMSQLVIAVRQEDLVANIEYLRIALTVCKLVVLYWVVQVQARSCQIHENTGGKLASGLYALLIGTYLRDKVLRFVDDELWLLMVM